MVRSSIYFLTLVIWHKNKSYRDDPVCLMIYVVLIMIKSLRKIIISSFFNFKVEIVVGVYRVNRDNSVHFFSFLLAIGFFKKIIGFYFFFQYIVDLGFKLKWFFCIFGYFKLHKNSFFQWYLQPLDEGKFGQLLG